MGAINFIDATFSDSNRLFNFNQHVTFLVVLPQQLILGGVG